MMENHSLHYDFIRSINCMQMDTRVIWVRDCFTISMKTQNRSIAYLYTTLGVI